MPSRSANIKFEKAELHSFRRTKAGCRKSFLMRLEVRVLVITLSSSHPHNTKLNRARTYCHGWWRDDRHGRKTLVLVVFFHKICKKKQLKDYILINCWYDFCTHVKNFVTFCVIVFKLNSNNFNKIFLRLFGFEIS